MPIWMIVLVSVVATALLCFLGFFWVLRRLADQVARPALRLFLEATFPKRK